MRRVIHTVIHGASLALLMASPPAFSQQSPSTRGTRPQSEMQQRTDEERTAQRTSSYNWNGGYGGGNLGGSFGGSDLLSALQNGYPFYEGQFYPASFGLPAQPNTPGIIAAYRATHANANSVSGGLHAGYNYFIGSILVGAEVDVDAMKVAPSKTTSAPGAFISDSGGGGTAFYTFSSRLETNYVASLRPRIGLPVAGALVYVTGGVALTTLNYQHRFVGTDGGTKFNSAQSESASVSQTKAGWTVGGGVEMPISPLFSFRTEYLFSDFGSVTSKDNPINANFVPPGLACGANVPGVPGDGFGVAGVIAPRQCFSHKASFNLNRVRLGLNFKI